MSTIDLNMGHCLSFDAIGLKAAVDLGKLLLKVLLPNKIFSGMKYSNYDKCHYFIFLPILSMRL